MSRRKTIAVIGSGDSILDPDISRLSIETGKSIIDAGYRLINGGLGGVMEESAKGAKTSLHYKEGDTVGIFPSASAADANLYIDIKIATGMGIARNAIIVNSADGVIAISGGAGTLSEIAMAWQMGRPIVCVGDSGWHTMLRDLRLDHRREDSILMAPSGKEAVELLSGMFEDL